MDVAGSAEISDWALAPEDQKISAKQLCVLLLLMPAFLCLPAHAQTDQSPGAKQLFEQERCQELVQLLDTAPRATAELNYYYGVALAHLERLPEARTALQAGA